MPRFAAGLLCLLLCISVPVLAQKTAAYTPRTYSFSPRNLPRPRATPSILNVPKIVPPGAFSLRTPPGFQVRVFAEGLHRPRTLALAPNGDVFCVESLKHRIIVLRDSRHAGRADQRFVFAEKLNYPFGIAFHAVQGKNYLYVANTGSVVRFPYADGQTNAAGKPDTVVRNIPERGYNQHWTRNILFSADGRTLYLTVGSQENLAEEPAPRATIMAYHAEGNEEYKGRVFASGMRNPVGLAFHPVSGELWTTVNERDYRGDDLVPDYVTSVSQGGFYGWPYYYIGANHDPKMPEKPSMKRRVRVPDVLLQAHSAPLGLCFYTGTQFPKEYQGDAFVALHGSANRRRRTGYKIIRIHFINGKPAHGYEDFVTGWSLGADDKRVWGRPVGIVQTPDGALLVSDDANHRIYRISYGK